MAPVTRWRIVSASGDTVGWVDAKDAEEAAREFLRTAVCWDKDRPVKAVPRGTR